MDLFEAFLMEYIKSIQKAVMPFVKGKLGEAYISAILSKMPGYSRILCNLYLLKPNNKTTEIDVLFIHNTGFYVIESKNYSGAILGNQDDLKWTHATSSSHKYQFFNPIKQNQIHINALKLIINMHESFFKSYIVFADKCKFIKIPLNSNKEKICHASELPLIIKNDFVHSKSILSNEDIDKAYNYLYKYSHADAKTVKNHMNNFRK